MDAIRAAANRLPERFIYLLYRSFLALLAPVVLFYAVLRVIRNRAYAKTLGERLGFLPSRFRRDSSGAIWIHAVSVGEVLAAGTLIRKLGPLGSMPVFVSVATLAGYRTAVRRLDGAASGCFYAPIDYVSCVRRILRTIKPSLVIVLETEIWPNLFREIKKTGCALLIANGRISDRAFLSYRKRKWFFQAVLGWPDRLLVQSAEMQNRFVELGADPDRVEVAGNLKFDFELQEPSAISPVADWLQAGSGPVLIAASTTADAHTDEDGLVIAAFLQLDNWRLILAPRKPERFESVAAALGKAGVQFWRRSLGTFSGSERVVLLDTIGELSSLFPLADVVFMGGTLTDTGGHNFLEPAFAAKPIVAGPRTENFREIAETLRAHQALISIAAGEDLKPALEQALLDTEAGTRAKECAEANRGAAQTTVERIRDLYSDSLVAQRRSRLARLLLQPLAALWMAGSKRHSESELRKQLRLKTPVISIGNITVGGTGKTPFVLHLAKRFRELGLESVVLTRGYGRISHRERLVLARGSEAAVWHTGDEPQILLRSGEAGLGIGPDRYLVGEDAERQLHPDVFLGDDSFSHLRLARDVDIVLIDSLDPFGSGEALPLGRLREPLSTLARADIFVITRCEVWRPFAAIERTLRQSNPRASIYRSWIAASHWISAATGQTGTPPARVVAFCGLGSPGSFWRSLTNQGIQAIQRLSYGDHHIYAPRELRQLARFAASVHAGAVLTTEKDLVNFPDGWQEIFGDIEVLWLSVEVEIENEADLLRQISPAGIRARRGSGHRFAPALP